jgi:hypothetical protein
MAVRRRIDPFAVEVMLALKDGLRALRIEADISSEPVRGTTLIRFFAVAKKFKKMDYSERQMVVWRIVQEVLTPARLRRISMIMTLTPEEFAEA